MRNINKIILPIICTTGLLAGCSKRQKVTLEVANDFCLKNYKAVTKECSQVSVDYNLHFNFTNTQDANKYSKLIVCWYSLYDNGEDIPKDLIKINDSSLTIKGHDLHVNDEGGGYVLFSVTSLGVRDIAEGKTVSYLYDYINKYYSKCDIYVANSNNIVINGTVKMGTSQLSDIYIPNGEDSFDNDGCYEKSTLKLSKGVEIKNASDDLVFTVSEDSSVTAKYSYY